MKEADSTLNVIYSALGFIGPVIVMFIVVFLLLLDNHHHLNAYDETLIFLCSLLILFGINLFLLFTKYRWIGIGGTAVLTLFFIYLLYDLLSRWGYYARGLNKFFNHYL